MSHYIQITDMEGLPVATIQRDADITDNYRLIRKAILDHMAGDVSEGAFDDAALGGVIRYLAQPEHASLYNLNIAYAKFTLNQTWLYTSKDLK